MSGLVSSHNAAKSVVSREALTHQVAYDFSLKRAVIEVDRDADRRWSFATDKMKLAEDKDEVAPNSAPLEDFNWDTWSK